MIDTLQQVPIVFPYSPSSAITASVPDCLPSSNLIEQTDSLIHEATFVD